MSDLRQRQEAIRSRAYLDGARGENCKFRFPGCPNDRETTVACHVHNTAFGMARKADDFSVIDGDFHCHQFYDLHGHEMDPALLLEYVLRGLQETLRNRIERGILTLKLDAPKQPKPATRKHGKAIPAWFPEGRKLQSRNNLRKVRT